MAHPVQNKASPLAIRISLQQLETTRNDSEKVVEVVRDAARELTHRFHLLCLTERLLGHGSLGDLFSHTLLEGGIQILKFFLGTLAVRHIAHRAEPLKNLTLCVGDGNGT